MNVEARRSELGRRRPATTRRVDERWVEPAGVDHHWLSGTASRKGPNPHRIVATCRRYELMAFNREVRWLWCGRQGKLGLGGWGVGGAVDWIPGILRRRRGVRGKQPPTSLHLVMPWHLSALRSKLSQSRHGSCENGQHQSRTFRAADSSRGGLSGGLEVNYGCQCPIPAITSMWTVRRPRREEKLYLHGNRRDNVFLLVAFCFRTTVSVGGEVPSRKVDVQHR